MTMTVPYTPESGADPGETELRLQAVEYLHGIIQEALRRDTPRDKRVPDYAFMGRYVLESPPTPSVPVQHRAIVLAPSPGKPLVNDIQYLFVKAPTPYYFRSPDLDGDGEYQKRDTPAWSDLFLEVVREWEGPREEYLLNNSDFAKYSDIETDLFKFADEIRGDLFGVINPEQSAVDESTGYPSLDLRTLHQLLHYPLQRQDV